MSDDQCACSIEWGPEHDCPVHGIYNYAAIEKIIRSELNQSTLLLDTAVPNIIIALYNAGHLAADLELTALQNRLPAADGAP